MYKDPSVGNLINIMIVKLVVVHNEQVSTGVLELLPVSRSPIWLTSAQVSLAWPFLCGACSKGHCLPCQSQVSREVSVENKRYYSEAGSHLRVRGG